MQFEAVTPAHSSFPIGGDALNTLIGVSPEIMAHWDHHRINKGYAGTPSERTQIKKEHELKEHSAFQLHKKELIRWKRSQKNRIQKKLNNSDP